jgi:hypothetical protein
MGQLGPKLRKTTSGYSHWCPACESMHAFYVEQPTHKGARWTFNGNTLAPTFSPSMNISWGKLADPNFDDSGDPANLSSRCHYVLTAGQIQFCGDCTHPMRGQTVPLPDLPPEYRDPT